MPLRAAGTGAWRRPSFWKLLWRFPSLLRLVHRLLSDRRVPVFAKVLFGLSVLYLLWPLDLLPDFVVPILNQVDDVAILLVGLKLLLSQTPPTVLEEHLANA